MGEVHRMPHRHPRHSPLGRLFHRVEVKFEIFGRNYRRTYRAGPHRGFSTADIEKITENLIEELDAKYAHLEFRQAQAGPNKINFICTGRRDGAVEGATA